MPDGFSDILPEAMKQASDGSPWLLIIVSIVATLYVADRAGFWHGKRKDSTKPDPMATIANTLKEMSAHNVRAEESRKEMAGAIYATREKVGLLLDRTPRE